MTPGTLPAGWAIATFDDVTARTVSQAGPGSAEFVYIDIGAIDNISKLIVDAKRIAREKAPSRARQQVRPSDVLVSLTRPNLNAVAQVTPELDGAVASTGFAVLRPIEVHPSWILAVVRSPEFIDAMNAQVQGALYPAVRPSDIRAYSFPLPPIAEQRRIVRVLDEARRRIEQTRATLLGIQNSIHALRQSLLAAAFRGDLTADWREKNPNVEPASVLLDRIRKERRQKWEEAEFAKMQAKGKTPLDDHWRQKYAEPEPVDTTHLPDLPGGWCWTSWQSIGFCQNGRAFPSEAYSASGIRLLRPGNLHAGGAVQWSAANTRYIPETSAHEFADYIVRGRELVVNLTAQSLNDEFLGRVCLTSDDEHCLLNQRIARLTPVGSTPDFCLWLFKSPRFRSYVDELNTGSLIQHMFTSQIDEFILPFPPLAEQDEIVRRVRSALAAVSRVEDIAITTNRCCDELDTAILTKAFRGELVSQDPNDEPAAVLLERIRAQRAADDGEAKRSRRSANGGERRSLPRQSNRQAGGATAVRVTDEDAEEDREAASRAPEPRRAAIAPAAEPRLTIHDRTLDDLLFAIRRALETGDRDRETLIRDVARELGFARTGTSIREAIDGAINTASRRLIIKSERGRFTLYSPSIDAYTRDELKGLFLSAIGTTWRDQEEAIRATARYLGFKRTGERIDNVIRSVINGLIRQDRLRRDGSRIRRSDR